MNLMRIAWINVLSALGITLLLVASVEAFGGPRTTYLALPVVWLTGVVAFIGLREADRRNRNDRTDA